MRWTDCWGEGHSHASAVSRYVQGDFRFRTGYCKSNPRKMVKLWAEKEFRNLSRLKAAGIRCPRPVHLRMHVLVMEFVGSQGVAAPRLKARCCLLCVFRPLPQGAHQAPWCPSVI